jgi:hypothetical protein
MLIMLWYHRTAGEFHDAPPEQTNPNISAQFPAHFMEIMRIATRSGHVLTF